MEERFWGTNPSMETRHDSNERIDKKVRQNQVLSVLTHPMTAKECAVEMYVHGFTRNDDRNNAAPRLTEMTEDGRVEIIGKTRCRYSGKTVTVYRRT